MGNRIRLVKNGAVHDSKGDIVRDPSLPAFHKGHKKKAGRPKGVANRMTRDLSGDIMQACEEVGYLERQTETYTDDNGKKKTRSILVATGKGGRLGYLKWLAVNESAQFVPLVRAVLPLMIKGSIQTTVQHEYTTIEDVERRMRELGIPTKIKMLTAD